MAAQVKNKKTKQKPKYIHGSAVPKPDPLTESKKLPLTGPLGALASIPMPHSAVVPQKSMDVKTHDNKRNQQSTQSVSLFAIVGFFAVASLMIFVMLAQVNYNEILRETVRLHSHMEILKEQQRVLAITFESAINMDDIERYAKDVLGMSKPEAEQITVLRSLPSDKVEVIVIDDDTVWWIDLRDYMSFLFDEYLRNINIRLIRR